MTVFVRSRCISLILMSLLCLAMQTPRTDNIDRQVQTDAPFTSVSTVYRKSHALLIGINRYKNRPPEKQLLYARNDVEELKQELVRHYGFDPADIITLEDEQATLAGILSALTDLSDPDKGVGPEDRILVFFSGHGQTVKLPNGGDMGFLLPHDAAPLDANRPDNPTPYIRSCLPMDEVWLKLKSSPAKHILLLADACYSGLLTSPTRAGGGVSRATLSVWSKRPAMQVITGGQDGETVQERDEWRHGAFTYCLLQELRARASEPGVVFTATELYGELERSVSNATESHQTPMMGHHQTSGEFLFIPTGKPAIPPAVMPLPMPQSTSALAHLSVESTPAGATVYVDGIVVGKTPLKDWKKDLGAQEQATVKVAVVLPGYETVRYPSVALEVERMQPLSVELKAVSTPVPDNSEVHHTEVAPTGIGYFGPVRGAGTEWPAPIYLKWFAKFQQATGIPIDYQAIGSDNGIKALQNKTVDFGASDAPLYASEETDLNQRGLPVVHIPIVGDTVVLTYNLPGIPTGLRFTSDIIADIYLGKIHDWNDPRIKAINPGINLPNISICPIHRSDACGATYIFTNYLKRVRGEWAASIGAGKSVNWPTGLAGKGNPGVTMMVKRTSGSIGYVELAYAITNNLPYGDVRNRAGNFVKPTVESTTAAIEQYVDQLKSDIKTSTVDAPGVTSYPICSLTYILIYKNGLMLVGPTTKLWKWAMEPAQQAAAKALYYAPLPPVLVQINLATLKSIRGAQ